jgi:hypothetical protein
MDRGSRVPRPECNSSPDVGCSLSWCFCLDILRHAIFTLSLEVDFSLSFTLQLLVNSAYRTSSAFRVGCHALRECLPREIVSLYFRCEPSGTPSRYIFIHGLRLEWLLPSRTSGNSRGTVTRVHSTQDGNERISIRWDAGGVDLPLAFAEEFTLVSRSASGRESEPTKEKPD